MITAILAVTVIVQALVFAEALRRQAREHSRRTDLLVNQLLHASGKPWQEAPAEHREARSAPEPSGLVLDPDQLV